MSKISENIDTFEGYVDGVNLSAGYVENFRKNRHI